MTKKTNKPQKKIKAQNINKYVNELIKTYKTGQLSLIDIITKTEAKGNVSLYQKALLQQINNELSNLTKEGETWANTNIPKEYKSSAERVAKDLANLGEEVKGYDAFSGLHSNEIELLVENMVDELNTASNFVGRQMKDIIRDVGLKASAMRLTTGSTVKQTKKMIINELANKGIRAIRTKDGRYIQLDSYASTVARTTFTEARNRAGFNQQSYEGYDLVRMSKHFGSCDICAPYQGRVFSISGNNSEYPSLYDTVLKNGYNTVHPNCAHTFTPYIPKYDNNPEETKRESNKNFNIDPRSKRSKEAYQKAQKKKREQWRDRRLYEKYKAVIPDKMPKTFSAFRSMKSRSKDSWKNLKNEYRKSIIELRNDGYKVFSSQQQALEWADKNYKTWSDTLPPKNKEALRIYSTNYGSETINETLRGKISETTWAVEKINILTETLDKHVPDNIIVYRGVTKEAFGELAKHIESKQYDKLVDQVISEKGFLSTSIFKDAAFKERPILVKAKIPKGSKGAYIGYVSEYSNELELLFNRNTSYIINNAKENGNKLYVDITLLNI